MTFPAVRTNISHIVSPVLGPSPSSDSTPGKPISSMFRARSTSPHFEEEKAHRGCDDTNQEARACPRSTLPKVQFPEENTPRRGSGLERVAPVPSGRGIARSSHVLLDMYQNEPDARAAIMGRRESSVAMLKITGDSTRTISETTPSLEITRTILETAPSLAPSGRGIERSSHGRFNMYQNEPDARAIMPRRESSVVRLEDTGESTRTIVETPPSLSPSRRGMKPRSGHVLLDMYRNEPDARAAIMGRRQSSVAMLQITGESTRTIIIETPPIN
jgi:hypothetical protein